MAQAPDVAKFSVNAPRDSRAQQWGLDMRTPACRRTLALSVAAGTLALGTPAFAQSDGTYEYAQPAPDGEIIFRSEPVIQGEAVPPPPPAPYPDIPAVDQADVPPPLPPLPPVPPAPPVAYRQAMPGSPPAYSPPPGSYAGGQGYYTPPPGYGSGYGYPPPAPAQFDRDAWLDDCHDRIRGVDRKDRAGVIGGLLGAVAGGVIGNRAWDSKRLAGTLVGAGVGGLAGVAIGSAIGAASDRRHDDECALYLDRYMAGGYGGPAYPAYGYGYPGQGYGYGYPSAGYALVPVLIAVPQRQVIRETVTEEWVDEPVRSRPIGRSHHPAPRPAPPRPDKRIKLTKGR
jgi:hypothetical protein